LAFSLLAAGQSKTIPARLLRRIGKHRKFRLFQSKSYGFRFVISAKGITRVGLGQSAIADALTPVPPMSEQQAIATYLDEKTTHIDKIVTTLASQIDKLKELRKTLINDVVTGKIKVVQEGETA